jgi:hypothetical protein
MDGFFKVERRKAKGKSSKVKTKREKVKAKS